MLQSLSVHFPYIPTSDLHDVFRVHHWLIQLRDVLLALSPARHRGHSYCEDRPQRPLGATLYSILNGTTEKYCSIQSIVRVERG